MKRNGSYLLWALLVAALVTVSGHAQTSDNLGDYARQVRKQKQQSATAVKKFDNDNLPETDKLSVVGDAPVVAEAAPDKNDGSADAKASEAPAASGAAKAKPAADPNAEKQKANEEWQKKIKDAQGSIDLLTRELDVLQREYKMRAAEFYADAGNRLRNSTAWDKDDAQYKDQIGKKQQDLDDAKKNLDDLQEQARKAGVPSSMRE